MSNRYNRCKNERIFKKMGSASAYISLNSIPIRPAEEEKTYPNTGRVYFPRIQNSEVHLGFPTSLSESESSGIRGTSVLVERCLSKGVFSLESPPAPAAIVMDALRGGGGVPPGEIGRLEGTKGGVEPR